jgi:hypothetical protein
MGSYLMADPSPPIVFTEEDSRQQIKRLIAQMKNLSPQEAAADDRHAHRPTKEDLRGA